MVLTHGVIGNTSVFGAVVLGSSPSGSTKISSAQAGLFFVAQRGEARSSTAGCLSGSSSGSTIIRNASFTFFWPR